MTKINSVNMVKELKKKEVVKYLVSRLWRTLLLVSSGILFAIVLGSLIDVEIVAKMQKNISLPFQIIYTESIGFISPGPRYILYPLLAALKESGVNTYIIIVFISSHVLIEPSTFFIESGFFGYRFPLKRFVVAFSITFLAGLATYFLID